MLLIQGPDRCSMDLIKSASSLISNSTKLSIPAAIVLSGYDAQGNVPIVSLSRSTLARLELEITLGDTSIGLKATIFVA